VNATLREQLRPIQDEFRSARPEVRAIVQVTCRLVGTAAEAVGRARLTILEWLRDKQRIQHLPPQAWRGESFEIDALQGQPVAVEAHGEVWALRYDNADAAVAGRTWRTEAILAWREQVALVGVRLSVISRKWDISLHKSIPRVVTALCSRPGLQDYGVELQSVARHVRDADDVEQLVALLASPQRTRPVYVVSEETSGRVRLDPDRLAAQTAGLAHVVWLHADAAWTLSDRIGKSQSAFGGAIRTYSPGFEPLTASFDAHPIATPEWLARRFTDDREFANLLTLKAIDASVTVGNLEEVLPTFAMVRRGLAEKRLREARAGNLSDKELLHLYEDDNSKLRADLTAADDLAKQMEARVAATQAAADRLEAEKAFLRFRIEQLEAVLHQKSDVEIVEYPETLGDLDHWTGRFLGDCLILLPRALRSARKAQYSDIRLVCDCLLLLGREYRDQRRGLVTKDRVDGATRELGVTISRSGDEARLLQWKDEYEVDWRGEKRLLDLHVKKGSSREPRNCLRIYFFFDDETEQVVVGHLPDHLTNDLT
jgi:hypothetical protein